VRFFDSPRDSPHGGLTFFAPPLQSRVALNQIDRNNAQSAGDLPPNAWGEEKAHTRDPNPTVLDPNDPKSKQTHIPQSETFQEYMARRQREGK